MTQVRLTQEQRHATMLIAEADQAPQVTHGSLRVTTNCKTKRQLKEAEERARRQTEGSMPIGI